LGRVADVLFAPGTARVAGYVVDRPRFLYLLDRKPLFVALDRTRLIDKTLVVQAGRDAWGGPAARRAGFSWDDTVIWVGMPARTSDGQDVGRVRDGLFDAATGELDAIGLTGGVTADLTVGVRDLPARFVIGFDGDAVLLADEVAGIATSGGAAAAAGKQAAVAKKAADEALEQVSGAARKAAAYGASAVRVAAKSEAGRKAAGWIKAVKNEVVDAMGDPDDD
jgi:uncharacterized protein YrrD